MIRALFTSVPVELFDQEPTDELRGLLRRRIAYARFLADTARVHLDKAGLW